MSGAGKATCAGPLTPPAGLVVWFSFDGGALNLNLGVGANGSLATVGALLFGSVDGVPAADLRNPTAATVMSSNYFNYSFALASSVSCTPSAP